MSGTPKIIPLRQPAQRGLPRLGALLQRIHAARLLLLLGLGLLVLQVGRGVRVALEAHRLQGELASLEEELGLLRSVSSPAGEEAPAQEWDVPAEEHPAEILRDLLRSLEEAGVASYRYRVLGGTTVEAGEEAEWVLPPDGSVSEEPLPAESALEEAALEMELGDADLLEWRIPLRVQGSYGAISSWIRSLQASRRIWAVPYLALERAARGVVADALVLTWTRAARESPAEPREPSVAGAVRDPFGAPPTASGPRLSPPPRLGAILWGSQPAVWLDGTKLHEGDRIGPWRVERIAKDHVRLRHRVGPTRDIRVDETLATPK
jgi:hypothetical protein